MFVLASWLKHIDACWIPAWQVSRLNIVTALGREAGVYVPSLFSRQQDPGTKWWNLTPLTDRTGPVRTGDPALPGTIR